MKKNSLFLSLLLATAGGAAAQDETHAQSPDYATTAPLPGAVARITDSSVLRPEYINNINVSAVRDFVKRFKDPANVRWYNLHGTGFITKFEQPGIACRVAYSKQGQWVYTIRSYHEKQLPHDIRQLVKSTYYDFAITGIDEVEQYNLSNTVYIVYLEDDAGYTIVRVCDGEMQVVEHLIKAYHKP